MTLVRSQNKDKPGLELEPTMMDLEPMIEASAEYGCHLFVLLKRLTFLRFHVYFYHFN